MQKIFVLLLAFFFIKIAAAQNTFRAVIIDTATGKSLFGVNVSTGKNKQSTSSDSNGMITITNIENGNHAISFSYTGYKNIVMSFNFPIDDSAPVRITMEQNNEELDEVIVQSTRTSRSIANTPTRIETISGEELDEKNNMRPSNVSMLLHESTGLKVQQTSATSGNASIRVQGLDGRYTQLLKDGYPNFGNFASGLSILEIPPLDLKQIEVIKGPASTLYGGGAIAGAINFISKTPQEKFSCDFILNHSNIGQSNIGGYISKKGKKIGYTFLAAFNSQKLYDADKDDFTEVPKGNNFTLHPKLFFYIDPSFAITVGNSYTQGKLTGGDVKVIKGNTDNEHTYFEKNSTKRNISTLEMSKRFSASASISLKQSISVFDREIEIPNYIFSGISTNSFTELSYTQAGQKHVTIAGINILTDKFRQRNADTLSTQSFSTGLYLQDSRDISATIKIESGLRVDYVNYKNINYSKTQIFVLPRVSVLFKLNNHLTSRVGGGLGYKTPSIFTEETESLQYRHVIPLNNVSAEKSIGTTADINYKTGIGSNVAFSINQMFFLTSIAQPLIMQRDAAGNYFFSNASKPVVSKGFETNIKLTYKNDLKLFAGFTYTDAERKYLTVNRVIPLMPKSKLNLTLMYEKEDNFKLGFESYFTGRQYLSNGSTAPSFWEFGLMGQKTFGIFSFFINFENFTDQRQSKYKNVVNPPHNDPVFDEIWNHTEGFTMNGGLKIKF